MSHRVSLIFTVSLMALGVSAVALGQNGSQGGAANRLVGDKAAPQAVMSYGASTLLSQDRGWTEQAPRSYQQLAQYSDNSMSANPYGSESFTPLPTAAQSDLSGGPLGTPMPSGTGPVSGAGSSGGAYYSPSYGAPVPTSDFPNLAGSDSIASEVYASPPQTYSSGTYSTGSGKPAPSGSSAASSYSDQTNRAIPSYPGLQPIYPPGYSSGAQSGPYQGGPNSAPPTVKRSFWDKIGLGNILFRGSGHARLGGAAVDRENSNDLDIDADDGEFVADLLLRGEASAVTQGGLEYGVALKLRGQYDRYHRGFAGPTHIFNIGDCPAGITGCASTLVNGTARSVRGATSRLYLSGDTEAKDYKIALEGAHLFLRGAYGDITLGRDTGAAALFSLDTPSTLPLARSSNLRVDYTGLDMTKTVNDASGFAEKVTYVSPRLLGDTIGFGVQLGASYAPSTEACGVDYCVEGNDLADVNSPLSAQLDDAVEIGIAIDRTFGSGLSAELVANYAMASESSGLDVFDDLAAFGLGLNLGYGPLEFGANYLNSNNGWAGDGDYVAYDAGLTYSFGQWGVTGSYGQSEDDLTGSSGSSALLGLSYELGDFTLGGGLQYSDRSVPVYDGTDISLIDQEGTALFLEGGFTF